MRIGDNVLAAPVKLHDAMEDTFIGGHADVACPGGASLRIGFTSGALLADADSAVRDEIVAAIGGVVTARPFADRVTYRRDGLHLYVTVETATDGVMYLAVFGAGEFQPMRYIVTLAGLFPILDDNMNSI